MRTTIDLDGSNFAPRTVVTLRTRTLAALARARITTVGQARSLSDQDLLRICNIGPKSVADLRPALAEPSLLPDDPLSYLAVRRPLPGRDEAIVRMRASGITLAAIARHFAISSTRVGQIIDRASDHYERP